jgi:hypothetical protein
VRVSKEPTALGPIRSRRRAELAARALAGATPDELDGLAAGAPLPRVRAKLARLAAAQRYEDAARLRDRIAALEQVVAGLAALERLRRTEACVLAPAVEDGFLQAYVLAGGRIGARRLPRHAGAALEIDAALTAARTPAPGVLDPEAADELLLVGAVLRRPPPEIDVLPLDRSRILAGCAGVTPAAHVA